jgi:folate-binding protein YgfZ
MVLTDINVSTYSGWHRWDPAAWLRVSGPDALSFLQGQCSQDLRPLRDGGAAATYGLWLSLKGKVVGDSFVLRGGAPDEFWVGSYFTPAATLLARLEAFLIADEVTLEDQTSAWTGLSLLAAANDGPAAGPDAFRFTGRRVAAGNVEWVGRRQVAAALLPPPGRELDAAQMKLLRLDAGIPAIPEEFGPADLPQEAGLEGVAVSFQKGCYLGQEVMARLWGGVLGGAVVPPALDEPDHDQLMEAMLHGALERSSVDSDVQLMDAAGIGVDACDQALAISYKQAGRIADAKRLIDQGIAQSGQFEPLYRKMAENILGADR